MTEEIKTPRTNNKTYRYTIEDGFHGSDTYEVVDANFSRDLERELTIVTSELEQARESLEVAKMVNNIGEHEGKRYSDLLQRAEVAEHQVATLVEALTILTDGTDATPFEVAQKIGRKALSTLPDRAKKIQAVVEKAKILSDCHEATDIREEIEAVCQAIHDLES